MTGKKKKKKDGRKVQADQVPLPTIDVKLADAISQFHFETVSSSKSKPEGEADTSSTLVEIVEPLLSLAVPQVSPPKPSPLSLPTEGTSTPKFTPPMGTHAFSLGEPNLSGPSFVFSAGQNSAAKRVAATPPVCSAQATECTTMHNARNSKQTARRREGKCPPSERFGKMGRPRQQILQLAAQEVAFGQGRDPLSLVVSYEENVLRRIVKVPEGYTSDAIVDSTLRQAVAGAALDSAGWQEALNNPKEDKYFAYSTAPEGLTVAKFRDVKGKVLVTPLSAGNGLLKLKEDAEQKKRAAEEVVENVRDYLQRLQLDDDKVAAGVELSDGTVASCAHCQSLRSHLQDLLKIVTLPLPVDLKKITHTTDVLPTGKGQGPVIASSTSSV
ncbi:hypothetical protein MPTK1_1g06150 [Marchantia polymorpha subsp. ruderalis]|uniref:Uncharacterized protein n=2 Tax=Marchantia polymorpha TaxID=3197 RepID=A0A176VG28_MARPO|nr:hypothetical protein AXG93_1130s1070 [Marchantia polymorpha subsp. ruderalis]PTQ39732.1 hypothetical protein MARPO_0043s0007 [Marchantia polymorpha]BBM97493.1 hypothetical protein Mp_1g06150 [Marchantia polymorpha subsp. ruderalis]|eukprot:PTQ39732.1 hypothetical protein MARPO_0043s0007 [Marchantia polymorpha]